MTDILQEVNDSYGPVLVEELMKRLHFTIDEFNQEIIEAFKDLNLKENNRQNMYSMIKNGTISSSDKDSKISQDENSWERRIKEIESQK